MQAWHSEIISSAPKAGFRVKAESKHKTFLCQSQEILWYAQAPKKFTVVAVSHTRLWHAKDSKSMLIPSLKQCSPGSLDIFPSQILYIQCCGC